ncbi:uncharacterized protein UBRO2_01817 [Ustilago bromivora]|uniref:Uncharacterized protein n=1 Tax=Ustilago bromivora TaxID=307758 RepID=A0A8H8QJQ8_9BASI|nr:uncharacterized protein UBRO2_01817 [Ustilago bromivora]
MTTTTDDSLDISAHTPDIYTSCPNRASGSATGKKNFTWSSADVLHLVTIIYDSASVKPNHIKAKLRWLQEMYYKEKKKLSLTGAGMLLEDMDASNLSYTSCLALSTKYAWFEKMHEMMNGRSSADPTTLIMTPSLNFTSNDKADMPLYSSDDIPMDLSGSKPYDHSAHGHGLPPILNLMDPTNPPAAIASTSGASIAGAGDDDIFTTPFPSQA